MKWAYAGNWGDKGFAALFTFILAGILGPRDFGLISIAAVYISFLQLFLDQGFATALIQRKDVEQDHLDSVFWMNVVLSITLIGISLLMGNFWARFNHAPEAAVVTPVLSISILIHALTIVQTALLKKNMDFRSLAIRGNVSVIVSGVTGIGLALAGFGVWALVGQQLVRETSAVFLLWKLSPWRPRLSFSWRHLRELSGFALPNFTAQLGIFVDGQAGTVALGLLFGPVAVGFYRLAERVTSSVISVTMSATQAVSLPEFARHQNDPHRLREAALSCIRLASTVTVPALAGLAAVSRPLMATIGAKWIPASGVLSVLCLVGILVIFTFFTGPLLQALGKTRALAALEWGRTFVGLICLVVAGFVMRDAPANWEIMIIAASRFATAVFFTTPFFLYLFLRLCRVSLADFLRSIAPSIISAVSVFISVTALHATDWLLALPPVSTLSIEVGLGAVVGMTILLSIDPSLRHFTAALVQKILPSRPLHRGA